MTDTTHDLLAELGWLRTLARRLARDPHLADDLVQDACGLALAQPAPPRSWRAWLAAILPNLLHGHRRREAARRRREGEAEGPATGDDGAQVLQRAEAQHSLAAAVLRLEEPHRAAVLLRFFEGLPPRRIATQLGVPVATVHSRLQRALAQLRQQLDHDFHGRERWLAALAPIAFPALPPLPLGMLLMQTKLQVTAAVAAAVLVCSAPLWWPASGDGSAPALAADARDGARRGPGEAGEASPGGSVAARAVVRSDNTPSASPAAHGSARATRTIAGRVCDCRGVGVGDVPIGLRGGRDEVARSAGDGAFTFATTAEDAELAAVGERFVTVCSGTWSTSATIAPVVVVADAVHVAGRVVDAAGAPVVNAEVLLQLPDGFDARFPLPLDRAGRERWIVRSGADGGFPRQRLPRIDGASLFASADAFAPAAVPLPPADDEHVQLVLARFEFRGGELRGRVVDPAGAAVGGARVAMGVTSVVSATDGTFVLSLRRAGWPTELVAAKAGHLPARLAIPRAGGTEPGHWPREIVLRLGTAPKTVRGRVVDQDRRPLAKAEVWITDPTPLGIAGMLPMHVEYLIAGGEVPPQAARMRVPHADDPTHDGEFSDQSATVPMPTACWFYVTADERGEFALPGLLDRSYTLRALDVASGSCGEAGGVVGDTFQEIVVKRDVWPELRGRVVSRRGEGIVGVRVQQHIVAFRHRARVPGGRFEGTALRDGPAVTTGADGSFVLRDVARQHCYFLLTGDPVVPRRVEVTAVADPLRCVWPALARCHVEVALQDPAEADEVACLDERDEGVDLAVLRRNSNQFTTDLPLRDGRSGLFVVGENAAKLVLRKGGAPVRTIPFVPDPARTTTLQ